MKALITGARGQLGRALAALSPPGVTLRSVGHSDLDIADAPSVEVLLGEFSPDVLINAAGFTRVDDAESQREAAERTNATGPAVLAAACRRARVWLVHVSTDYVFDGEQARPYAVDAHPNPLSVYGSTKLAGELAVTREIPSHSIVVRTSWVYAAEGRNFLHTMLQLMRDRPQLRVVSDQIGVPTSALSVARALWALSLRRAGGIHHWCDSGVASWYDFAIAIREESVALGVLKAAPPIVPIGSADYPTAARRPPYSVLDKRATEQLLGMAAPHWRDSLRETLRAIAAHGAAP